MWFNGRRRYYGPVLRFGRKQADKNTCILGLDINSDSYVFFAAETGQAEQFAKLTEQLVKRAVDEVLTQKFIYSIHTVEKADG